MIPLDFGPLARLTLPVSGVGIALRHPTGLEDILLAEGGVAEIRLALGVAESLAAGMNDLDLAALPACDLAALLLMLRRALIGARVVTDTPCAAEGCGARLDLSFSAEEYLAHHRPRHPPLQGRGWSVRSSPERPHWHDLVLCDTER